MKEMTARSRLVMAYAKRCALGTGSEKIEPVHLLIGLLEVKEGVAATALREFGFTENVVLELAGIEYTIDLRQECDELPHNLGEVFNHASHYSEVSGNTVIGTEHLLLGLLHDDDGEIAKLVRKKGTSPAQIRERVMGWIKTREDLILTVGPIPLHFGGQEVLLSSDFFLSLLEVWRESGDGVLNDKLFVDVLKFRIDKK